MPHAPLTAKHLAGDLLAISIAGNGLSDDQRTTCALAAEILGGHGPLPSLQAIRSRLLQVLHRIQHEIDLSPQMSQSTSPAPNPSDGSMRRHATPMVAQPSGVEDLTPGDHLTA